MQELSKEYGTTKAFKDEELFDKITALTYPAVGEFLKTTLPVKLQFHTNNILLKWEFLKLQ